MLSSSQESGQLCPSRRTELTADVFHQKGPRPTTTISKTHCLERLLGQLEAQSNPFHSEAALFERKYWYTFGRLFFFSLMEIKHLSALFFYKIRQRTVKLGILKISIHIRKESFFEQKINHFQWKLRKSIHWNTFLLSFASRDKSSWGCAASAHCPESFPDPGHEAVSIRRQTNMAQFHLTFHQSWCSGLRRHLTTWCWGLLSTQQQISSPEGMCFVQSPPLPKHSDWSYCGLSG